MEQSCWAGVAGVTRGLGKVSSGTDGEFDMGRTLVKYRTGWYGSGNRSGLVVKKKRKEDLRLR